MTWSLTINPRNKKIVHTFLFVFIFYDRYPEKIKLRKWLTLFYGTQENRNKNKKSKQKKTSARVAINSYPYHAFGLHIPVWYAIHVDTKGKPKNILHILPQKERKTNSCSHFSVERIRNKVNIFMAVI